MAIADKSRTSTIVDFERIRPGVFKLQGHHVYAADAGLMEPCKQCGAKGETLHLHLAVRLIPSPPRPGPIRRRGLISGGHADEADKTAVLIVLNGVPELERAIRESRALIGAPSCPRPSPAARTWSRWWTRPAAGSQPAGASGPRQVLRRPVHRGGDDPRARRSGPRSRSPGRPSPRRGAG
jgi:hypothetical protein